MVLAHTAIISDLSPLSVCDWFSHCKVNCRKCAERQKCPELRCFFKTLL